MTPESHKIACISNFHVTPDMLEYLADLSDEHSARVPFGIWSGTYGAIIAVCDNLEAYRLGALEEHDNLLFPIVRWALAGGYKYVMFDRDAGVAGELPNYCDAWETGADSGVAP